MSDLPRAAGQAYLGLLGVGAQLTIMGQMAHRP
jgi:hypothetical protein